MSKIGLIGSVCLDRKSSSGQAIRTTILYNALVSRYGDNRIVLVNTHNRKSSKLSTLLDSIKCIFRCKDIIVMVSSNGRKFYYPILYYASKLLKKRVFNNVIGGNFAEFVENNPKGKKYISAFKVNWIQMQGQVNELIDLGVKNVELLQNTKEQKALSEDELEDYSDEIFKFCTFSRISIPKGIEIAIKAIEGINKDAGRVVATLDIYGIPDDDYKERFERVMKQTTEVISYGGYVDFNRTIDVLKNYYALLFPTTFFGEGFPGTVWDALAAGIPTIATNWRYNSEVIHDGKTGLIYDYDHPELLKEKILFSINNRNLINEMKRNCIEDACNYAPDKVFPVVFKYFD